MRHQKSPYDWAPRQEGFVGAAPFGLKGAGFDLYFFPDFFPTDGFH